MKRKVLLALSTVFKARGGIPRFNQLLCRSFDELASELGFDGEVISQDDDDDDYRKHGSPWKHLRFLAGGGKRSTVARTWQASRRLRPDLFVVGHLGMSPLGVLCGPWLRRGFAVIAHGTEAWAVPRWSRRASVRRARFVWAVSQYTGDLLSRATGADPGCVRLLPNALEPGLEAIEDPPTPQTVRGTELLSVARLSAEEGQKGIDYTLQAVAELATHHSRLRYRIVGRGNDKPRLVALAKSLDISERVEFEEDLTDEQLADRYRRCDVFVLPSGQEGFGIVFLEAMRFGKPCIGGDAGGTPEVIADGETGLLVPFGDVEPLKGAIARLLGDRELRARMGRTGLERLRRNFVYDRYRSRVRDLAAEWLGE